MVARAAFAVLLHATLGLGPAMGAGMDPNQPVSSRDASAAEPPAVSEGVAGRVLDQSGAAVADAFVQVAPADPAAGPVPDIAITTDDRGRYQWPLRPGRYIVSVAPPGFAPQTKEIVVEPDQLADLDFVVRRAQR